MSGSKETKANSPFPATSWTMVNLAQQSASEDAFEALSQLCEAYWYPLYAFLRGSGSSPEDASDLTQGFLAALVEKEYLKSVDRNKGKLRTFLLDALTKFRSKEYRARTAQKRGGQIPIYQSTKNGPREDILRNRLMILFHPNKLSTGVGRRSCWIPQH